ncbi:MAG: large conductance mechanosensitive channel protein MscL [Propionibacteriaceae bacterium]|nr:large conductance mechanosensitive channel protein MscL [Propionibacteriaceae bacterium]
MKGFKEFLMRGNVVSLAVAVIVGTAFTAVVTAFSKLIMSIIGLVFGEPNFDGLNIGPVNIGVFITAVINFLLIAAVVYFLIVKPMAMLEARKPKPADEPVPPTTEELLTQIRDLLAKDG